MITSCSHLQMFKLRNFVYYNLVKPFSKCIDWVTQLSIDLFDNMPIMPALTAVASVSIITLVAMIHFKR